MLRGKRDMKIWKWQIVNTENLRTELDKERKSIIILRDEEREVSQQRMRILEARTRDRELTIERLELKIEELNMNFKNVCFYHYELNEKYKKLRDSK